MSVSVKQQYNKQYYTDMIITRYRIYSTIRVNTGTETICIPTCIT